MEEGLAESVGGAESRECQSPVRVLENGVRRLEDRDRRSETRVSHNRYKENETRPNLLICQDPFHKPFH